MFYRSESDQYINEGSSFSIDGTTYPSTWLNMTSLEDKTAIGLVEVTFANSPEDDRFYWVSDTLSGAVRTYINTPKDLNQLKTNWVSQINQTAYTMLLPSDWMVTKGIETSTPVPTAWGTYRAGVRTAAGTTITAINASTTITELQTAIQVTWPNDPNYIAPVATVPEMRV
jgi:hypothetical protein